MQFSTATLLVVSAVIPTIFTDPTCKCTGPKEDELEVLKISSSGCQKTTYSTGNRLPGNFVGGIDGDFSGDCDFSSVDAFKALDEMSTQREGHALQVTRHKNKYLASMLREVRETPVVKLDI
ncbi:hypothetical protein MCOR03_008342 [Pyricularia oryzae]|nr:hypothetical protein MCOR03_008342 [Pyricularia oryzae]